MKKVINMDLASEERSGGKVNNFQYSIYLQLNDSYELDFTDYEYPFTIIRSLENEGGYYGDKLKELMDTFEMPQKYLDEICSALAPIVEEIHTQVEKGVGNAFEEKTIELCKSYNNQIIDDCKTTYDESNKTLEFAADDPKIINKVAEKVVHDIGDEVASFSKSVVRQYSDSFEKQFVWSDGEFNRVLINRIKVISPFKIRHGFYYDEANVVSQDYEDPIKVQIKTNSDNMYRAFDGVRYNYNDNSSDGARFETIYRMYDYHSNIYKSCYNMIVKLSHYLESERPFGETDTIQFKLANRFRESVSPFGDESFDICDYIDISTITKNIDLSKFEYVSLDEFKSMENKLKSAKEEICREIEKTFGDDFVDWISVDSKEHDNMYKDSGFTPFDDDYKFFVKNVSKSQIERLTTKVSLICQGLTDLTDEFAEKIYQQNYVENLESQRGKLIEFTLLDILDFDQYLQAICKNLFSTSKEDFDLLYQITKEYFSQAEPIQMHEASFVIQNHPRLEHLAWAGDRGVICRCSDAYGSSIDLKD